MVFHDAPEVAGEVVLELSRSTHRREKLLAAVS